MNMKQISIKNIALAALAAISVSACSTDNHLREKINPDELRSTNIYQLKKSGLTNCNYKVDLEAVVMSSSNNFASGTFAIQDGNNPQEGMLLQATGNYQFGEVVLIHLDGTIISEKDGVFTLEDPDGTHVAGTGTLHPFDPVNIQPSKMDVNYQAMYVSLEGFQVIEEDLEKTYSEGIRIETEKKDTLSMKVLSSASFANHKVAQGSGKISGVVSFDKGKAVIMPQAEEDIEFTDKRFIIGDPNYAVIAWSQGGSLTGFVSEVSTNQIKNATELSGAANCFVVSKPGVYKFAAKAGNGAYPAGIKEGSMIYFKLAAVGGNAVVAYLSPEDGSVLWTWHIWASPASMDEMSVTRSTVAADDGAHRTVVMLDRLLGAVSTVPGEVKANGVVYQWGRKDALPGPSVLGSWSSSGDNNIPSGSDDWTIPSFDGTELTTVNTEVFPPFNYMNGTDLGEATQSHQAGSAYATTYIGNSSSSAITGYPSYADTRWAAEANPCPAGWHVPNADEAKAILGVSASYSSDDYIYNADGVTPGMDISVNLGCKLKGLDIWFPNNGNRARKNARYLNLGSRHFSWTDAISSSNGVMVGIQKTNSGTTINPGATGNRGNATGVRCVKDNSYKNE